MNKFGKRLVIALMASSMLATPVYAAPNTDEIKAEKEQKEKEVESVQAQLQTMVSKISETEEKLVSKGEEIQKAKEDLAAAEEKQQQQYESMKVRIKYMYEQGDTKALEDLFTSNSIADFLNQADYIETVHNYDREKLQEYVETTKKIENLKKTLEEDLANLEEMQTSFESQKEQLSQTLAEKQAEVESPENIIPTGAMPHACQEPYHQHVANPFEDMDAAASHRNIYVVPEKSTQGNMPSAPKIPYRTRYIWIVEILQIMKSHHASHTNRHIRIR